MGEVEGLEGKDGEVKVGESGREGVGGEGLGGFGEVGEGVGREGAEREVMKKGRGRMGGWLILSAITVCRMLWGKWGKGYIWIVLGVLVGRGGVGF